MSPKEVESIISWTPLHLVRHHISSFFIPNTPLPPMIMENRTRLMRRARFCLFLWSFLRCRSSARSTFSRSCVQRQSERIDCGRIQILLLSACLRTMKVWGCGDLNQAGREPQVAPFQSFCAVCLPHASASRVASAPYYPEQIKRTASDGIAFSHLDEHLISGHRTTKQRAVVLCTTERPIWR